MLPQFAGNCFQYWYLLMAVSICIWLKIIVPLVFKMYCAYKLY